MSEYIANLNAIPSAQEMQSSQNNFNIDDDLAMFTNTQFFDFDVGNDADLHGEEMTFDGLGGQSVASDSVDLKTLDFTNGDFAFPDFSFSHPSQSFEDGLPRAGAPAPINTNFSDPLSTAGSPPASALLSAPALDSPSTLKRKSPGSLESYEDASRLAAEEDKRRRNTAASARFRVKKKQREQALERSAKEMSDKVSALEGRINQLETENKWLKNLITEKNETNEDIAALWKKYNRENNERAEAERKGTQRKDGVGTKA